MIAERESTAARFNDALRLHRQLGVRSRRVNQNQLAAPAPAINPATILDTIYLTDGGVQYTTPVSAITRSGTRAAGVSGDGFEIECGQVVIAAGAATNSIASFLGCDIPAHPVRIEAMALEPVRLVLRPAVALLDRLCYRTQTRDPLRQCANPGWQIRADRRNIRRARMYSRAPKSKILRESL
jgi:sarcosine oxidase subunit beta